MVNSIRISLCILHGLMKLVGMRSQEVEIEPGTVMHFWAPSKANKEKPAVVFVHGFAFNGILTWLCQVLAFAGDSAVYVPDLLFFGGSTTDKTERSPAFQATSIAKGLRKLGVEKCTLVGMSYGGMVGFKMAEMYPDLVDSMVASCTVMALTESITRDRLQSLGLSSWDELLLPVTVEGLKRMLEIGTFKLPWIPNFVYKDILEALFDNRKERHELLEALIVKDEDFRIPHFPQWDSNQGVPGVYCQRD